MPCFILPPSPARWADLVLLSLAVSLQRSILDSGAPSSGARELESVRVRQGEQGPEQEDLRLYGNRENVCCCKKPHLNEASAPAIEEHGDFDDFVIKSIGKSH